MVRRMMRGLVYGGLGGALLGLLTRALMRVAAVGMQTDPEFDPLATGLIVSLFALSGAGAGLAAAAGLRPLAATVVVLVSSGLLLLTGGGIGVGETVSVFDKDLSAPRTTGVLAAALSIGALALATPFVGWRLGRTARR